MVDQKKDFQQDQMDVETLKFDLLSPEEHISRHIVLPHNYGDNKIVALTRDPWWIFAYWEVDSKKEVALKDEIKKRNQTPDRSILRVYDISGVKHFKGNNANRYFDITLVNMAKNWYINVGPNCSWCVDIGILSKEGDFYLLARSNIVKTPRFGMSDRMDAVWMCKEEEYWTLFALSGGYQVGKSSMEMKELFQKYMQEWTASGGKKWISSGAITSSGNFFINLK
ncbi:MAG: DUF4912 domain-containing protein [Candidatus Omnitrophota bacterium]